MKITLLPGAGEKIAQSFFRAIGTALALVFVLGLVLGAFVWYLLRSF